MRSVRIKIVSVTTSGEGSLPTVEQEYRGSMAEKGGKFYVMYREDARSGLEGVKTILKWDGKRMIIIRSGSVEHRQEFAAGLRDSSVYKTLYLTLPLVTETHSFTADFGDNRWRIAAGYLLFYGEDLYGEMKLSIEIEEEV